MIANGWYTCPICHRNLMKVEAGTLVFGLPVYCRKCKISWYPTISEGREIGEDEPFDRPDRLPGEDGSG